MDRQLYVELLFKNYADDSTIMQYCPNINAADSDGETTLYKAVNTKNYDLIKRLLDHGANYNAVSNNKKTPLSETLKNDEKIVNLFTGILRSELQTATDEERFYMVVTGQIFVDNIIPYLKKRDHTNFTLSKFKISPLHIASINDSFFMVDTLLENGAYVNALDSNGDTPLIYSAFRQDEVILSILLHHKANPSIRNKKGKKAKDYCDSINSKMIYRLNTAETFPLIILAHKYDVNSALHNSNIATDVFKIITRFLWDFVTYIVI